MIQWLKHQSSGKVVLAAGALSLAAFVVAVLVVWLFWLLASPSRVIEWDLWNMFEGLASTAAFATVIGGGVVILAQLVETVDSRNRAVYNEVFQRMMRDEEIEARRWIYLELPGDPEQGIASLSPEGQRHVKLVLNSFDHLGFLLKQDWITDAGIIEWVSPIVVKTWEKLGPYVEYEARRRGEPYYYFAARHLADRCREWWQKNRSDAPINWIEKAL